MPSIQDVYNVKNNKKVNQVLLSLINLLLLFVNYDLVSVDIN